ncbi:MAG: hypothetical protein ACK5JD_17495 [Mangrovibacterium sp.]
MPITNDYPRNRPVDLRRGVLPRPEGTTEFSQPYKHCASPG